MTPYKSNRRKWVIIAFVFIIIIAVIGIRRYNRFHRVSPIFPTITGTSSTTPNTNSPANQSNVAAVIFDCTANNHSCPEITIQGDLLATLPNGQVSPFHGYADPSMRKDPLSNRIWMSYSWPNIHYVNKNYHSAAVDIHLAYSDDGGNTWHYQGPLWLSNEATNKGGDNGQGFTSHEVSNILPAVENGQETWYGIHWDYFLPAPGGYGKVAQNSTRLVITQASTPAGLANSETATLGSTTTSSAWGVDTNLSALSPDLSNCGVFFEPALYYQSGTLYLVTVCTTTSFSSATKVAVFSTQPQGDIKSWKWQYKGVLASTKEANELGGDGLTQVDIAKSTDGSLLMIASIIKGNTVENHLGCKAVQIQSLDSPQLTRDSSGQLITKAYITTSDLLPVGTGACTYDPGSSTGMLVVRRSKASAALVVQLNDTGIKP